MSLLLSMKCAGCPRCAGRAAQMLKTSMKSMSTLLWMKCAGSLFFQLQAVMRVLVLVLLATAELITLARVMCPQDDSGFQPFLGWTQHCDSEMFLRIVTIWRLL